MEQPIACSLSSTEYATRRDEIARLGRRSLRSRESIHGGSRLILAAEGDTERELRALISAEARCCPFLRFELERDGELLRLDVTGPAEARPIIAELFA